MYKPSIFSRRTIVYGCVFWGVFCVAAVVARGVRWDENYEFAQIILGQVHLPNGHPLVRYVCNAFSLQTYLSAALLWLTGSAVVLCALRNVLFIAATVFPPYLFGARLSGRAIYGHVAALLILFNVHVEFDSSYPQFVWPDLFSNGHVGIAWALAILFLVMCDRLNWAFLLAGLMPCIHIGQTPPVFVLLGLVCLGIWLKKGMREVFPLVGWFGAGLLACGLFWLIQRPFVSVAPLTGPYAVTGDVAAIWEGFVARHDLHRSFPPVNAHIVLMGLLAITGVAMWRLRRDARAQRPWSLLFAYSVIVAGMVWSILVVHHMLGVNTPLVLIQWMPYRLINHAPVLLVAVLCAVFATRGSRIPTFHTLIPTAALAYCIVQPVLEWVLPASWYGRYATPSAGLLFALFGAAWGVLFSGRNWKHLVIAFSPCVALVFFHRFGTGCLFLGIVLSILTVRVPLNAGSPAFGRIATVGAVLAPAATLLLLGGQAAARQSLPVNAFAREVHVCLASRNEDMAVLLGQPQQLLLQAQTGHPVMGDMALPYMITYLPAIGPVVEKMFNDLYGVSFLTDPIPPLRADLQMWREYWRKLSGAQWNTLAHQYGFAYVVSPHDVVLQLPLIIQGSEENLYCAQ